MDRLTGRRANGRRGASAPLLLVLAVGACGGGNHPPAAKAPAAAAPAAPSPPLPSTPAAGGIIDSILPIDEEIRRFRAMAPGSPTGLTGGASSRDALVNDWVGAVERADTTRLREMLITPQEFIAFYYPASRYTAPPYRQGPRLLWFMMSNNSSQGAARVLQRHGGQPFGFRSYACGTEERVGTTRTWSDCRIRRTLTDGRSAEMRYFGGIIERGGAYKFLSYATDY